MTELLKNILQGASTVFSIDPSSRRKRTKKHFKPHKSDSDALRSDWQKISGDFDKSLKRVVNGGK